MSFQAGFATDQGLRRSKNQDAVFCSADLGLFLVADGMGGHRGGETASQMVVKIVPEMVGKACQTSTWQAPHVLEQAFTKANREVFLLSCNDPELEGMGTTATALLFQNGKLHIAHVGDSRAYYISKGCIWQLTRDHSLVEEKLRAGILTREAARRDPMKNVITRSVGFAGETLIDIYEMSVQKGDVFLVCSDGLTGEVENREILNIVQSRLIENESLEGTVADLIALANSRGGKDNTTVLVVRVV
jgi:protein phosphatase